MFLPTTYSLALAMMLTTMIAWGSWANTLKLVPGWPFPLFYWDYVAGMVGMILFWGLTLGSMYGGPNAMIADLVGADPASIGYALAGGAVFNVANLLLVAAISVAGLAVAFPVGIGLALVMGVLVNYGLSPKGDPLLLFGGVAIVLVAVVVDALAYRARGSEGGGDTARGLKLAVACGVLMGSFYPLVTKASFGPTGLGPYAVALVFSVGVLLCALPVNAWLMRRPITDDAPVGFDQYRAASLRTHAVGWFGGAVWGTGMVFSVVAATTDYVGPAVSYAIGQGATMVSAAWGVFVWREFAGAPAAARRLLVLMFPLFLIGLGLVALAPLYA